MSNEKINSKIKLSNLSPFISNFEIPESVVLHFSIPNFVPHPFIFYDYFLKLFEHSKYFIIFLNYKIFEIVKFRNLYHFPNKKIQIS